MPSRRGRAPLSSPRSAVACSLCGFAFDPASNPACPSCPLFNGCSIVCCPRCGHDTVDPAQSSLVQLGVRVGRSFRRSKRSTPTIACREEEHEPRAHTLADVVPGGKALVRALDGLDDNRREHLQAYGLVPGRRVRVMQHSPVTVVQVEHTQVAFESHLAGGIEVELLAATR